MQIGHRMLHIRAAAVRTVGPVVPGRDEVDLRLLGPEHARDALTSHKAARVCYHRRMTASTEQTVDDGARRLPAGRKAELAAYVAEVGQVTVARLAKRFDVSADTIRRDLDQLDADGVLIRTHGGAVSLSAFPRPDTGLDVRARVQASAKDRIGALAAGLVPDGASLIVNAGTTTLAAARHLRDHRDLTIATNSLRISGGAARQGLPRPVRLRRRRPRPPPRRPWARWRSR